MAHHRQGCERSNSCSKPRLSPVYRAVAGNPEHLRPHAPDGRMLRAPSEPQITLQDAAQPRLIWLCIIFHGIVSHG